MYHDPGALDDGEQRISITHGQKTERLELVVVRTP